MAEQIEQLQYDGQEVQKMDYNLLAMLSGLADDRVLAELLRMQPFDGTTIQKAVVPFSLRAPASGGVLVGTPGCVIGTGGNNGSIRIRPFRAVVGSRNTNSGSQTGADTQDSAALANWRDIRSGIFIGSATTLTQDIVIAPNTSGNARWDLVYCTVAVDANGPTVTRRVKDPNSAALSTPTVSQYLYSPVTVTVLQGTPGSPAAQPSLPADGAGNYNIALAYVRVPNGFGASTNISSRDIVATASTGAVFQRLQPTVRVASGNNDKNAAFTTSSGPFYYNPTSAGSRPGPFMPPDWGGREEMIAEIDLTNASNANWSHQNGGVVDDTVDWRYRFVECICAVGSSSSKFATDPTASGNVLPYAASQDVRASTDGPNVQYGNSLYPDGNLVTNTATLLNVLNSTNGLLASGSQIGLYVDMSTGKLLFFNNGTAPLVKLFIWLRATGQMPNL